MVLNAAPSTLTRRFVAWSGYGYDKNQDMAEKKQLGISQMIKTLGDEYSSRSSILSVSDFKTLISSVAQNLSKVLINNQLLILASNRKLNFHNTFKRETSRTEFLDAIKNHLHRSAINNFA